MANEYIDFKEKIANSQKRKEKLKKIKTIRIIWIVITVVILFSSSIFCFYILPNKILINVSTISNYSLACSIFGIILMILLYADQLFSKRKSDEILEHVETLTIETSEILKLNFPNRIRSHSEKIKFSLSKEYKRETQLDFNIFFNDLIK